MTDPFCILRAVRFAAEKHRRQRRKDADATPYINHPVEVAELLASIGGVCDEALLIAALLHDTIEDTDTTPVEIENAFGKEVLDLVLEVTDDKALSRPERKRLQVVLAPSKSPRAKQLKIADKICNLRSILSVPPPDWPPEQQRDYFDWAREVFQGLQGVNSALDAEFRAIQEEGRKQFQSLEA